MWLALIQALESELAMQTANADELQVPCSLTRMLRDARYRLARIVIGWRYAMPGAGDALGFSALAWWGYRPTRLLCGVRC